MDDKKVVSLEHRLPNVRPLRRRRNNMKLLISLAIIALMLLILGYLQSPYSRIRNIEVSGNRYMNEAELIKASGVTTKMRVLEVTERAVAERLARISDVKSVKVKRQWPNRIRLEVTEYERIAYVEQQHRYVPLLEDGRFSTETLVQPLDDAPLLFNFKNGEAIQEMTNELLLMNQEVRNAISEVYLRPTENDPFHLTLYMAAGHEVSATIYKLGKKLNYYPSIAQQIPPNVKGIIHLDVGAYFKPYGSGKPTIKAKLNDKKSVE